ncbi:hypothetical protein TWF225_004421 [Orbilia oligospora]|nr:hypothetical protein TWF225_004421 [Orbilia oligospora]KAF3267543.1 hypothetical protein TWF128_009080 [Orbilia oligospora]KAF3269239.1 hypothetical protein TWF217_009330 [Orbilia oligospora]
MKGHQLCSSIDSLGRFKRFWKEYALAADIMKIAIRVLENTLREFPDFSAERNLFMLKGILIETYITSPLMSDFCDSEDIIRQIEETLQIIKVRQPEDSSNILRFELLRALCLRAIEDFRGSITIYERCLAELTDGKPKGGVDWIYNIQGKCGSAYLQLN